MEIEMIGDIELAQKLAAFFEQLDYPFLGVELRTGERYPLVSLWHDASETTRFIACARTPDQLQDAVHYAETMAAVEAMNSPMPVIAHAICAENAEAFMQSRAAETDYINRLEKMLARTRALPRPTWD